jgi:nicotinate-nucleotide adenylyltransferase
MRLGLMGGTFDPIHYGHLFIAEEARVRCGLDEVLFFPNNQPAHREGKDAFAEPEARWELTQLGIAGNEYFRASRIELDRPGPSYAIDTLLELESTRHAELFYIVGADSINDVLTWYRADELFEHCRFIAASRPDFDLDEAKRKLSAQQLERVQFLEVPGLHIASRDLRQRVRDGQPIRYLTPDAVVARITELNLYR